MTKSDIIDLEGKICTIYSTSKAILFSTTGNSWEQVWLPRSVVEIHGPEDAVPVTISLPEEWAQKKGLI